MTRWWDAWGHNLEALRSEMTNQDAADAIDRGAVADAYTRALNNDDPAMLTALSVAFPLEFVTEEVAAAEAVSAADKVLARLGADGGSWIKRAAYDGAGGVCLSMACQDKTLRAAICKVILEQYSERVSGPGIIQSFNDHWATSFADVAAVLEKAALLVDEQAAAA